MTGSFPVKNKKFKILWKFWSNPSEFGFYIERSFIPMGNF